MGGSGALDGGIGLRQGVDELSVGQEIREGHGVMLRWGQSEGSGARPQAAPSGEGRV